MGCDLQISNVGLPAIVPCPCPVKIPVDVINLGPDAAMLAVPMLICLDIGVGDRPPVHYSISTAPEEPPLPAGLVRTFVFTGIQFPCATAASVRVTADCGGSVPDNIRTNPSVSIPVVKLKPLPWLWTDLRIGLRDSTGYVAWGPGALCLGAELVVEANIRNAGCDIAVASVTELDVFDDNGQSVVSLTQGTPPIAPGVTRTVQFASTLPAAVPGQNLTVQACADSTGLVLDQCDRQRACARIARPTSTGGGPPALTLSVARPIFPGEAIPIAWQIENFCTDLGEISARILFQGVELYRSSAIHVGLQDAPRGEELQITPSGTTAASFYRIGTKQLTLEISGTGTDPGPFTTAATITVKAEPVPGTWMFTLPASGTTIDWKVPYSVAGRLTNPAHAAMSPTSLALDETSNVGPAIERNAIPIIGALTSGAIGTEAWSITQAWSWLAPGVWIPIGPQSGLFVYTVTFAMQDEFGNAYPPTASPPLTVAVRVSTAKLAFAATALALAEIALTLLALAFLALAGYYTAVAAPPLFAAFGAVFTAAGAAGLKALDPPVPDFDYHRVVPASPLELPATLTDEPGLAPVLAVVSLLARTSQLGAAMSATEARLIGARIDGDEDAIRLQSDRYRDLRDSALTATSYLPLAVDAAIESEQAQPVLRIPRKADVRKIVRDWSSNGIPAKMRRAALAGGLSAEQLDVVEQMLTMPKFRLRPIEEPLREISQAAANLGSGVQDEADLVLRRTVYGSRLLAGLDRGS